MDYDENDAVPSAPPPSYDDVVAAGASAVVPLSPPPPPTPSAPSFPPPPSAIRQQHGTPQGTGAGGRPSSRQGSSSHPRQQARSSSSSSIRAQPQTHRQRQTSQRGTGTRATPTRQMQQNHFLQKLANFNMAYLMLKGVSLPSLDVDLDSEAHLPNRQSTRKRASKIKRIKYICCGLWCCGFILLFFLLSLPVAMLLTGIFGYDRCPHNNGIIVSVLIATSVLFFATLVLRLLNSALSCCKLGNMCKTEKSMSCSACIGIMEGCFLVFVALTTIVTLMGTWFILSTPPDLSLPADNPQHCDRGVYYASLIMTGLLYFFSLCLVLYLVAAALSYCTYQDEMNTRRRLAQKNVRRARPRAEEVLF